MSHVAAEMRVGPRPGRWYYGWIMLSVAILIAVATSPGQTFGVSAFTQPLRDALSLSHTQISAAYTLGTLLASLPLIYLGRLIDRHGLRITAALAAGLLGIVCLAAALTFDLLSVFVLFFLLRLLGPGVLSLASSTMMPFWFDRRLGAVEGLRQSGMAVAIAVVPALNLWLIDQLGWRLAFAIQGLGVWLLVLPVLALVWRDGPASVGQEIDGHAKPAGQPLPDLETGPELTFAEARRRPALWVIFGVNGLWAMTGTAVTFHVVPLIEARGLPTTSAAGLMAAFATSMAIMHVVGGVLADRWPARWLMAIGTLAMAAAISLLAILHTRAEVMASGALMGLTQGLTAGISTVACVRCFGRREIAQIRGALTMAIIAASGFGPLIVGGGHDLFGGYTEVLGMFVALSLMACALTPWVRPPQVVPASSS